MVSDGIISICCFGNTDGPGIADLKIHFRISPWKRVRTKPKMIVIFDDKIL